MEEEYWDCLYRAFRFDHCSTDGPTSIVDDGGDATLMMHAGYNYEKNGVLPEDRALAGTLKSIDRKDFWTDVVRECKGLSERPRAYADWKK